MNFSTIFVSHVKRDNRHLEALLQFKEYEKNYFQTNGKAISTQDMNVSGRVLSDADRLEVNDPLHYAREASYTQSAYSVNPKTGSKEGGLTGAVLRTTSHGKGKWLRVFGLHFITTPSNLFKSSILKLSESSQCRFNLTLLCKHE